MCHLLGDYEESITRNNNKAAAIYKENCDVRNSGRSCAKYGTFAYLGKEDFVAEYAASVVRRQTALQLNSTLTEYFQRMFNFEKKKIGE